jgi:raffinose/stachyose/melibiose transport system permease protein
VVYPVAYSGLFSFSRFQGFGAPQWIGIDNYVALANDPFFWQALQNTLVILVVGLGALIPASFGLALLLHRVIPGGGVLRALVFGPAIIAPILVGLIWVFILDPKIGLFNRALEAMGMAPVQWIGGDHLTPLSVSIVFIWSSVGFAMTIFYAGLQLLPSDVMEASALDGATGWQQVWHVKIPMMRETFAIVTILMITNIFKIFELVYMLTGGGPVHRSETLVSYMYFVTFTNQQYGYGMALAVVITLLGALVSVGYLAAVRKKEVTA